MKKSINRKIMLLGANDQAMLVVARQLAAQSFSIDVADWQDLPVKYSKHISSYYILSDLELCADSFVIDLCQLLKRNDYLFLLPINDAALEVCVNFRETIMENVTLIGVPEYSVYSFSHNKHKLIKKCISLGIDPPPSIYIDCIDGLERALVSLSYPVVAKPIHSKLIKDNKLFQFNVKVAYSERELVDILRENILNVPYLIQKYLNGKGVGYNILSLNGDVLLAYQHERLTEPDGGGASSYRKTVSINTHNLKSHSEKIIKSINWTGPAMIEYKVCNDIPYIMEINGRFWGSVFLGVKSGLNFPVRLIDILFYDKNIPRSENSNIVYVRNFKMDFKYALAKARKNKNIKYFLLFLFSLKNTFRKNEFIEDSFFIDFKLEFLSYFLTLHKVVKQLKKKACLKLARIRKAKAFLGPSSKIAFVCFENIYRSPFAQLYAKKNYGENYEFFSFGFYKQDNRLSPMNALKASEKFGIDMKNHSSLYLSNYHVDKIDVFFVMDKKNYQNFKELYPQHINKVFFLSYNKEIQDPYKKDDDFCVNTFSQIAENIDFLFHPV